MKKEEYAFSFEVYDAIDELDEQDSWLLNKARKATQQAYAPYSRFNVGAVARLENGEVVTGTNQENASYPVGMCAERGLLAAAGTLFPGMAIHSMAISYNNENGRSDYPISPCGMCRQALLEHETRVNHPVKIILSGQSGKVYIVEKAGQLLPLSFTAEDLAG